MNDIMWDFITFADVSDSVYSDMRGITLWFLLGLDTDCRLLPQVVLGWFGVGDGHVQCTWSSEVPPFTIKNWCIEMLHR